MQRTENVCKANSDVSNYYNYGFGVSGYIDDKGTVCSPRYKSENALPGFNWNEEDEIEMKLDLTKQTWMYIINGEKIVTIDNVYNDFKDKPDVKYRMANNIRDRDMNINKIELVSYECLAFE